MLEGQGLVAMKKRYFVDLFAGCGGLSAGLESEGFVPAYVNEINPDALNTYLSNRERVNPLLGERHHSNDIKQLTQRRGALARLSDDLNADYGIPKDELDLVVGGPPCQGFSVIGHRPELQGDQEAAPIQLPVQGHGAGNRYSKAEGVPF